jgi:hypothetical protein
MAFADKWKLVNEEIVFSKVDILVLNVDSIEFSLVVKLVDILSHSQTLVVIFVICL